MTTAEYGRAPAIRAVASIAFLWLALFAPAACAQDAFLSEWYEKLETVDLEGLEKLIAPGGDIHPRRVRLDTDQR